MLISINVPTYKRADKLNTFKLLPGANYWIHKNEVEYYRKYNRGIKVKILPDSLAGNVAKVRNYILKMEINNDVIVQVDDDFSYIGYYESGNTYRLLKEEEILLMIEKYSMLAQEWGVKLWGINVNQDKQCYREYSPFSTTVYISASFSCFLKGNKLRYDERFSLKEDYDMALQQLNVYRKVLRVNKYFYVKKSAEQVGGCSAYRNVESERKQFAELQKKWGSEIIRYDNWDRSHSRKKGKGLDINPVLICPIQGI